MMGRTHAISGTLVFGGATLVYPMTVPEIAVGLLLTTAASLWPDIDHHRSTITKTYWLLTKLVHWLIGRIFGPHRHGTHSILFIVITGVLSQAAIIHQDQLWAKITLIILLSIITSGLIRLFKIKGWLDDILPIPIYGLIIFFVDLDLSIVPVALMLGTFAHIAGDCLTDRGCPLLWPLSKHRFGLSLFTTGKRGEIVAIVLFIVGDVAVIAKHVVTWYLTW